MRGAGWWVLFFGASSFKLFRPSCGLFFWLVVRKKWQNNMAGSG
jgi:hypothetical protein